jgi:hypothetical protein
MSIISLKPNFSRLQAIAMFNTALRRFRHGELRMVLDFYMPYYFFRLSWDNGRAKTDTLMALDAMTGKLDPYQFDDVPGERERMEIDTALYVRGQLDEQKACEILKEQMTRQILMRGFFKLTRMTVTNHLIDRFYLPYWIGVYQRGERAHIEVIGALRGKFEGAKVHELIEDWFLAKEPQERCPIT